MLPFIQAKLHSLKSRGKIRELKWINKGRGGENRFTFAVTTLSPT